MMFTPPEWCLSVALAMAHNLNGVVPTEDAPQDMMDHLLYGSRWLWEQGIKFELVDYEDEGPMKFKGAGPARGAFACDDYTDRKGVDWILAYGLQYGKRVMPWKKLELEMIQEAARQASDDPTGKLRRVPPLPPPI
jgi:hypothetical protein